MYKHIYIVGINNDLYACKISVCTCVCTFICVVECDYVCCVHVCVMCMHMCWQCEMTSHCMTISIAACKMVWRPNFILFCDIPNEVTIHGVVQTMESFPYPFFIRLTTHVH